MSNSKHNGPNELGKSFILEVEGGIGEWFTFINIVFAEQIGK